MGPDTRSRQRALAALVLLTTLLLSLRPTAGLAQQTIVLAPGWNNILYQGPGGPIEQALAPIADELTLALHWDATGQRWQIYFPPAPQASDLHELEPGQTYWLAVQNPTLLPRGSAAPQPAQLTPGWNNVPYWGPGAPTSALLESSPLWAWDALNQRWRYYDPMAPAVSDVARLVPLQPYWLYVTLTSGQPSAAAVAATPAPATRQGCYPFRSAQPTLAQVDDALTRAGLATLPVSDDLKPSTLRSGADGNGPRLPAYVPPTLMRAIAWVETSWHQATVSTPRGDNGLTITSPTCAYGLMQILSGMNVQGDPTPKQLLIGSDFQANAAAGAQLLTMHWNRDADLLPYLGRHDPHILEDWYFTVWSYHCFGPVCPRYGAHNDPDDPFLPWPRPVYNSPDQLQARPGLGYSDYPYQELVYGLVAYPPVIDGKPLWQPVAVQLPPHGSVGYPEPRAVPEPAAHLDNGESLTLLTTPATPLTPAGTRPAPIASPTPQPLLVPPATPPAR